MEETLVKYLTAKLANEKGFKISCRYAIMEESIDNSLEYTGEEFFEQEQIDASTENTERSVFLCPTQTVLQKWLRETHNIAVMPAFNDNNSFEYYYFIHTDVSVACSNRICSLPAKFGSYEEALEEGLFNALNLVQNEV